MEQQISKHSFRVPDGYFDHVADEILAKIDLSSNEGLSVNDERDKKLENSNKSLSHILRPSSRTWAIAASFLAAIFALGVYLAKDNQSTMQHSVLRSEVKSHFEGDFDYAADYAMIDNEAIYASLINSNE